MNRRPVPPRDLRVLILHERDLARREWNEIIPYLRKERIWPLVGSVVPAGALQRQLDELACPTFALGSKGSRSYPACALRLARIARRNRIDIIHGNEPIPGVIGAAAGLLARTPLRVFHRQHTSFPGNPKLTKLSRWAAHGNDVVLAVSEASARCAEEIDGVRADRVRVAHNGATELRSVSDAEVASVRARLAIPADAAVISAVARLDPVKGLDALLAALPLVQAATGGRPVHLIIAGSGEEEQPLRSAARAIAPGFVHFVGHQTDVAPWFHVADAVAMPSRREALGIAGAEAMSCARPLVASRVGGLVELVDDGATGVLVPPGDVQSLASALAAIIADPGRAQRMGAAGRRRFEQHFTNHHMVDGWIACYQEFLGKSSARRSRRR